MHDYEEGSYCKKNITLGRHLFFLNSDLVHFNIIFVEYAWSFTLIGLIFNKMCPTLMCGHVTFEQWPKLGSNLKLMIYTQEETNNPFPHHPNFDMTHCRIYLHLQIYHSLNYLLTIKGMKKGSWLRPLDCRGIPLVELPHFKGKWSSFFCLAIAWVVYRWCPKLSLNQ